MTTSRELLSAVRWRVHGATLVVVCLWIQSGVLLDDSALSTWGRPTLWLASVYGLMFCAKLAAPARTLAKQHSLSRP